MNIRQQYNTIQPILLYDTKTLDLDHLLLQRINIYGTMNIMYELKVKIPTSVINLISFYLYANSIHVSINAEYFNNYA